MRYAIVLNGCEEGFLAQAELMNGFIEANNIRAYQGTSIIFYQDETLKDFLISNAPTTDIILARVRRYQPEVILKLLCSLEGVGDTRLYLFPGNFAGNELSVRFACRRGGSSLTGVNSIRLEEHCRCYKDVYSSHMEAEFLLKQTPYCLAIAKGSAGPVPVPALDHRVDYEINEPESHEDCFIKEHELIREEEVKNLENAKFILAAGRGIKKKEELDDLKEIAKELGAEFGVSRPIAMNAWAPMNQLIGVSGAMVKPRICITTGVSGAAAFMSGIDKSDFILSVNTDPRASVVKMSDVSIIEDYKEVMPRLLELIKQERSF